MLKNYLIVALRNIRRHRTYSAIKIFGLSLGTAACILIYLFIIDELSYDRFHENGSSLFRVVRIQYDKDSAAETGRSQFLPTPTGPQLQKDFPEIVNQTRMVAASGVVRYQDQIFRETLTLVDHPFLEMFTFPLLSGSSRTALAGDQNLVLSRSAAAKYFGGDDPLGKMVTISYGHEKRDFQVTAVAEDPPRQSSLQFDILIPFANLPAVQNEPNLLENWRRWYCPFFVQLRPDVAPEVFESSLDQFCRQYFGENIQRNLDQGEDPYTFGLQPVDTLYFDTRIWGIRGLSPSYLLSAVAIAILLIACVNFMNLSVGLSSIRSMEVGMRKVVGAQRRQLIKQFIGEALVISSFAVILGVVLTQILLPKFNSLADKNLSFTTLFSGFHLVSLAAIALVTGLVAGSYPAVIMSSFRPVEVMKGKLRLGGKTPLTQGLVVLQFSLSVILIISAVTLGRQVSHMVNRDPGYASDGLAVILTQENEQQESERIYRLFRNEIGSHSLIQGVTASNREFGVFLPGTVLEMSGREIYYRFNRVDADFISTMKMELVRGRDFSPERGADAGAVIVNERFMEMLGPDFALDTPLGDPSRGFPYSSRIIGVIKDCHYESLRNEIGPLLLYTGKGFAPNRDRYSRMIVRIDPDQTREATVVLEEAWKRIRPEKPFIQFFQGDVLRNLYSREIRWSVIIRYASALSILLACLGVFGLTSMTLSRREKEFGIRKVLGAGAGEIVRLALKEFVLLIAAANIIAWPAVYFIMRNELENYPYRITLGFPYFLLAGAASLVIAVLTILYLSMKSAHANPVDSLKYE